MAITKLIRFGIIRPTDKVLICAFNHENAEQWVQSFKTFAVGFNVYDLTKSKVGVKLLFVIC